MVLDFANICFIGKTFRIYRSIYECESASIPALHVASFRAYLCINNYKIMGIHISTSRLMLDFNQYKELSFFVFFLHIFSYVRLRKAEPVLTVGQRQQHILACLQALTFDLLVKDLAGVLCDSIYSDFFCKLKHKLKKKGTKVEKFSALKLSLQQTHPLRE